MNGIHEVVLNFIRDELEKSLITNIDDTDPAKAGVVKLGPLQGEPDPDAARISLEVYENDPDQEIKGSGLSISRGSTWEDTIEEIEIGGCVTWRRMFTVKARCLLVNTQEELDEARSIASTVRSRIEKCILGMKFNGLGTEDEYVSRGPISETLRGSMTQLGGPGAYDYQIKIRFEILTTQKY